MLVDLSLFCFDAYPRKCVCLKTKPKPEEQASRQTSARRNDKDSMNSRNSLILDPTAVDAFEEYVYFGDCMKMSATPCWQEVNGNGR